MRIEFTGKVTDGKLHIINRKQFDQMLPLLEGKDVVGSVERKKKKRSNPQNAFYWSCVIPILQNEFQKSLGEPVSEVQTHELLKCKFNSKAIVSENTGEIINLPQSTTELSTTEFEVFIEECRRFSADFFDVKIPEPNEQTKLEY